MTQKHKTFCSQMPIGFQLAYIPTL